MLELLSAAALPAPTTTSSESLRLMIALRVTGAASRGRSITSRVFAGGIDCKVTPQHSTHPSVR